MQVSLKSLDEFSGTAAGNLANAYSGICYAQLGKYEDAVKYLDKFQRQRPARCSGYPGNHR